MSAILAIGKCEYTSLNVKSFFTKFRNECFTRIFPKDAYPERFVQNTETMSIHVIMLGLLCPGNELLFSVHVKKIARKKVFIKSRLKRGFQKTELACLVHVRI